MKKLAFLYGFLFLQTFSFSQIDDLPKPTAYFSAIIVTDIDQSIDWYSKNLGFEVLTKQENEARGFKQANLKCGAILIELIELKQVLNPDDILKDEPRGTKVGGFFKFGIQVDAFEKWIDHLKKNKVNFHGQAVKDPVSDKQMIIIKDPDGNRIQLFER